MFHIPQYAARALAALVLLGAVLLVALTRTQVGRDAVAGQAIGAFNRTFEGTLEIGPVSGNLIRDLYARDARLYDPDGALVLAVDSVVFKPSWRANVVALPSRVPSTVTRTFTLVRWSESSWAPGSTWATSA